jgi:hypothetical protein
MNAKTKWLGWGIKREWTLETVKRYAQILLEEPKPKPGGNGTAALNRKVVALLRLCNQLDPALPISLIEITARQLKVSTARDQVHLKEKQERAIQCLAADATLSSKKLAGLCGVTVPTITRWRKDPSFEKEVQLLKTTLRWWEGLSAEKRKQFLRDVKRAQKAGFVVGTFL